MQFAKTENRIPTWAAFLLVVSCTLLAFWILGGQHYVAHKAEIDYSSFHHEEDMTDPMSWFYWFFRTGFLSGIVAFLISTTVIVVLNTSSKSTPQV